MQRYQTFAAQSEKTAVALGFFDGVHLAHQAVLRPVAQAKEEGLIPTALTFSVQNRLPPNKQHMKTILTDEQKLLELEKCGMEQTFLPDFADIAAVSPEDFFEEILIRKLNAAVLSCGYDYTFGQAASGNAALLQELCDKHSVRLLVLPKYEKDGVCLSATNIRLLLQQGEIAAVNQLLGYDYYTLGEVLHGRKLGSTIGFPTINQAFLSSQVIPKYGVYKTTTVINGITYQSITNIGVKPTIKGERAPSAESYIIGFEGNLYGAMVKVCYHELLREERKFSSVEELKQAIAQDVAMRESDSIVKPR